MRRLAFLMAGALAMSAGAVKADPRDDLYYGSVPRTLLPEMDHAERIMAAQAKRQRRRERNLRVARSR